MPSLRFLCAALLLPIFALGLPARAAPPKRPAPQTPASRLVALKLEPAKIVLNGALASQRLLVTGRYRDGSERDLTAQAKFRVTKPGLALLKANALTPLGDGSAAVIAEIGKLRAQAALTVQGAKRLPPVSFINDVEPLFTKIGCNQGTCHGQQNGQGGFKLSLRAWDAAFDLEQIAKADNGKRIHAKEPQKSLLLMKPTMETPHGGGPRIRKGSKEYQLVLRWIQESLTPPAAEAKPDAKAQAAASAANAQAAPEKKPEAAKAAEPEFVRIVVSPAERILPQARAQQRLLVTARYSDGSTRDVTSLARYQSQNDAVARVDEGGLVTAKSPGESAIMVSYGGDVQAAGIAVPRPHPPIDLSRLPRANPIDGMVYRKLAQMRIPPSGRATDAEFLRRVSLDVTATLPTPEATRAFLADRDPKKRAKLIDRLLDSPEFVDYRALKLADLLRVNGQFLLEEGADTYYRWIRDRVRQNMPYDRFARELLTGRGSTFRTGPANYFRVAGNPQELAETTAQTFLGVRMQCAQCHNHPFEKWKQRDYYGLAAFFARVGQKYGPEFGETQVFVRRDGEAVNPRTKQAVAAKFPGGPEPKLDEEADRRALLADWLTAKENRDFARVAVNRLWADLFGVGIVDAPDDFRISNPPSNAPLLEWLANEFIRRDYDVKQILRIILNSETYQRSSVILPGNAKDERHYSRAYPRRIPAEPLLDAIAQVTGKPDRFGNYPPGWKAVQVRDSRIGSYFLEVFGRPKREILCGCERSPQPNLAQSLHLINSGSLNARIAASDGRLARLLRRTATHPLFQPIADRKLTEELYLLALNRFPTRQETLNVARHLAKQADRRKGYEDVLWALLNAQEFLFLK